MINKEEEDWHPAEHYISSLKMNYEPFVRSTKITESIIVKMKERLPKETKFLAFAADCFDPQVAVFRNIFAAQQIPFAEEPARHCIYAEQEGKNPYAQDGYHWNEHGHHVIAKELVPELRKMLNVK